MPVIYFALGALSTLAILCAIAVYWEIKVKGVDADLDRLEERAKRIERRLTGGILPTRGRWD